MSTAIADALVTERFPHPLATNAAALVLDDVVKYFGSEKKGRPWGKGPVAEPVKVVDHISRMRHEHSTTVFLTTHDMDEADCLCDRIAIITGGRSVALDTPQGLKELVGMQRGSQPQVTMEDVFMALTGRSLDDDLPPEE